MSILLILPLVLFLSVCYRYAVNKDLYKALKFKYIT